MLMFDCNGKLYVISEEKLDSLQKIRERQKKETICKLFDDLYQSENKRKETNEDMANDKAVDNFLCSDCENDKNTVTTENDLYTKTTTTYPNGYKTVVKSKDGTFTKTKVLKVRVKKSDENKEPEPTVNKPAEETKPVEKPKKEIELTIVEGGLYQHFKGNYYRVMCLAKHSETLEDVVVYSSVTNPYSSNAPYSPTTVYVRPKSMWNEVVTNSEGKRVNRFTYIPEDVER